MKHPDPPCDPLRFWSALALAAVLGIAFWLLIGALVWLVVRLV